MTQFTSLMLPVLKLFLIPVGGGIPAGVMLARANDLAWPITTGLYLISDIILALAFEPILRLLAALAGRIPFLARFRAAFKEATADADRPRRDVLRADAGPLSPREIVVMAKGRLDENGGSRPASVAWQTTQTPGGRIHRPPAFRCRKQLTRLKPLCH